MLIIPVVMCGGAGVRLCPLSTSGVPKQYHSLFNTRSLLLDTLDRVTGAPFGRPIIMTAASQEAVLRDHLLQGDAQVSGIVLEPSPKNTAPCAVAAALLVSERWA